RINWRRLTRSLSKTCLSLGLGVTVLALIGSLLDGCGSSFRRCVQSTTFRPRRPSPGQWVRFTCLFYDAYLSVTLARGCRAKSPGFRDSSRARHQTRGNDSKKIQIDPLPSPATRLIATGARSADRSV